MHPQLNNLLLNLKNIPGWRSRRKLLAFAVDDYGNVRLHSRQARENLVEQRLTMNNRFDMYDAMETRQDLEQLYDVLSSVTDMNGNSAVFTPYALSCNIDFESVRQNMYNGYIYEPLPKTLEKLEAAFPDAYRDVYNLLKEGMSYGLIKPEFHGREHLNLKVFTEKLRSGDPVLIANLNERSYTGLSSIGYPTISYTASYSFWNRKELRPFTDNLLSGIQYFKEVYGYAPAAFTPPSQQFDQSLESVLIEQGIHIIDKPLHKNRHKGRGIYKREINTTGYRKNAGYTKLVRNVVFEPNDHPGRDWPSFTLKQIEAAFRWNKPALISSHRVNFCGHISPHNRSRGLTDLKKLLKQIVKRWPDVEFVSVRELGEIIKEDSVPEA